MVLDKNSPKPLYAQLEDILRTAILNKEWEVNHAIPSEIELSRMYSISRMTVRAVITQLVNEGMLYRVQGKGTFVAEPKISTKSLAYMGVREQLERMGYQTSTASSASKRSGRTRTLPESWGSPVGTRSSSSNGCAWSRAARSACISPTCRRPCAPPSRRSTWRPSSSA